MTSCRPVAAAAGRATETAAAGAGLAFVAGRSRLQPESNISMSGNNQRFVRRNTCNTVDSLSGERSQRRERRVMPPYTLHGFAAGIRGEPVAIDNGIRRRAF